MKRRTKSRSLATPDLTPLIDVVFLLLIFFMLVTTFDKYSSFNLELPTSGISSELEKKEYELIIDKNEKYFIKYDKVSEEIVIEDFSEKLKFITEISISADKTLNYGTVVKTIGELKNAGITKVELNFYE
ncbi:ExbD/TolR family protein [Cetobacterium sp.]|uniref:ExbD/TolR family protein n=1 Tax=Cetobacterium sp. TaxID=2071632 RepID=UPI002FCC9BAE